MIRNIDIREISDGRLYGLNDLVKADCGDCKGCSDCCQGMGESIVLDPLDVQRLVDKLQKPFAELIGDKIELHVVEGVIQPNLRMVGDKERCAFLTGEGRCSIHSFRPGICRLFPLGRFYENQSFQYFLQIHECKKENRTKVKVKRWIDTPDIKKYEEYIKEWHYFLKNLQELVGEAKDESVTKYINMYVLQHFYQTPFAAQSSFYEEIALRIQDGKDMMNKIKK